MKRLKIPSLFKQYQSHFQILCLVVFISLWFKELLPITSFILCLLFWYWYAKDRSIYLCLLLLLIVRIPHLHSTQPDFTSGRVSMVKEHSFLITNNHCNLLVHSDYQPTYDEVISFTGTIRTITSQESTYGFDSKSYYASYDTYYEVYATTVQQIQPSRSLRGLIYQCIRKEDSFLSSIQKRLLFGIKEEAIDFLSLFETRGFGFLSFYYLMRKIVTYFLEEKMYRKFCIFILVMGCFFYHFPVLITFHLLIQIAHFLSIQQKNQLWFSVLLMLCIFPSHYKDVGFLISVLFRFMQRDQMIREYRLFLILCLQSILFHSVNVIEILVFRFWFLVYGILYFFAWITILLPLSPFTSCVLFANRIYEGMQLFQLPGSMLGFGLLLFCCLLYGLRNIPKRALVWTICFLVFQWFGLFHPLGEVTFINVGQGDSILIRLPMNQENILIDTGKPSQFSFLEAYLKTKGIRNIQTLIITHDDEDHSGNKEDILTQYSVKQCITKHSDTFDSRLKWVDLNEIENENLNQSSLVYYMQYNGLSYLFMGDGDIETERKIIQTYDALECDVLKVGHHGSNTSSSQVFLDQVKPHLAIISAGSYSLYHHPHPDVIKRFESSHIPYLNTRQEGDISIFSLFSVNFILTSRGKIAIMKT